MFLHILPISEENELMHSVITNGKYTAINEIGPKMCISVKFKCSILQIACTLLFVKTRSNAFLLKICF